MRLRWFLPALANRLRRCAVASQFASAAQQANIAVAFNSSVDASFQTSVFSSIIASLERGTTRVVVALADPSTCGKLLDSVRDTRFEFVLVDPMGLHDAFLQISLSGIFRTTAPGVPRGLFAFGPKEDSTNYATMIASLAAFNSTAFSTGFSADMTAAYDAVFMLANGLVDVYNAGGDTSSTSVVRTQIFSAPKAFVGSYTFNPSLSSRTGDVRSTTRDGNRLFY
jgi:hypothetical protein